MAATERLADYTAQIRRGRPLIRAVAAFMSASATQSFVTAEAARMFPSDRELQTLTKAVVSPATTITAEALTVTAVSDLISVLSGVSAGAKILNNGLNMQFDGANGIAIPSMTAAAGNTGWIAQGSPIPVKTLNTGASAIMTPHKLATIITGTRETFDRTLPTIEAIVKAVLYESVQLKLDETLLSTAAGTAVQSAGIRNGIAALAASALGDPLLDMLADVKSAVSAVATVANNSKILLVASPTQAVTLRGWRDRVPYDVMGSAAVSDGDLIAVAMNSIASALNEIPRFEQSREAALHLEDATALAIGTAGTPNSVAAPTVSLWQHDLIGMKMIFEASWMRRSDSGVAWVTGANGW